MRLRDDAFLKSEPAKPVNRRDFDKLRGIGLREKRASDDFVLSFGEDDAPKRPFSAGDVVEFDTPDGIHRNGSLLRKEADHWLVEVDENSYNLVPESYLTHSDEPDRKAKRAALRQVLANTTKWRERELPQELNEHDFRLTIDYGSVGKMPSNDELCAYVQDKYAARVLDAEPVRAGVVRVIATKSPHESPPENDEPGLETEEIEGTGKISYALETMRLIANANPHVDFVPGTISEDEKSVSAAFSLETSNGDKLYLSPNGNVTPDSSMEGAVPAVGYVTYDGQRVEAGLHGAKGETALTNYGFTVDANVKPPYSSGTGPQGTRFDDKEIPVKAEEHEAAGQGEGWYTKDQYEQEKARYDLSLQEQSDEHERAKRRRQLQQQHKQELQEKGQPQDWMTAEKQAAYGNVVFVQGEDYDRMMEELGPDAGMQEIAQYLSQWDIGKYYDVRPESSAGGNDDIEIVESPNAGRYLVSHNRDLGYAGLEVILPDDDKDSETIAEPGEVTAADKEAVDDTAKEYYKNYYGDYGDKLVDDIKSAWISENDREPTKEELSATMKVLKEGSQMVRITAATMPRAEFIDDLSELARNSEVVRYQLNKMMAGYIASNPGILQAADETTFQKLLTGMHDEPRFKNKLKRIHSINEKQLPSRDPQPEPSGLELDEPRAQPQQQPGYADDLKLAHNLQPAKGSPGAMCPRVERISGDAGYLHITLVWDPDCCEGMSSANIRQNLISHVKGMESKKDFHDFGHLGRVRFTQFDCDIGLAEIKVRSSDSDSAPLRTHEVKEYADADK